MKTLSSRDVTEGTYRLEAWSGAVWRLDVRKGVMRLTVQTTGSPKYPVMNRSGLLQSFRAKVGEHFITCPAGQDDVIEGLRISRIDKMED